MTGALGRSRCAGRQYVTLPRSSPRALMGSSSTCLQCLSSAFQPAGSTAQTPALSSQSAACSFFHLQDMSGRHSHPVATRAKLADRQSPLGVTHAVFTLLKGVCRATDVSCGGRTICCVLSSSALVKSAPVMSAPPRSLLQPCARLVSGIGCSVAQLQTVRREVASPWYNFCASLGSCEQTHTSKYM